MRDEALMADAMINYFTKGGGSLFPGETAT